MTEARRPRGNYDLVVAAFCGLLLISNIGATKAIAFDLPISLPVIGPQLITDGGAFLFPLTYVLGDVLAEVYGFRRARRAIWMGFALAALASVTFLVVSVPRPRPTGRTRRPGRRCWASCPGSCWPACAAIWPGSS